MNLVANLSPGTAGPLALPTWLRHWPLTFFLCMTTFRLVRLYQCFIAICCLHPLNHYQPTGLKYVLRNQWIYICLYIQFSNERCKFNVFERRIITWRLCSISLSVSTLTLHGRATCPPCNTNQLKPWHLDISVITTTMLRIPSSETSYRGHG
jgi:hypothetical protein